MQLILYMKVIKGPLAMTTNKALDNLLEDQTNAYAHEDAVLEPLLPAINQIKDVGIRTFVRSTLMKAAPFFWKVSADLDHNNYPADEKQDSGLVLHTIRVARVVAAIATIQDCSQREMDVLLAAALLHDITKAVEEIDGSVGYDPMHPYTVDGFVQWVQEYDDKYSNDAVSSTLFIDEESIQAILRIIRCQKGIWSVVPETTPITSLEWTLAIAEYLVGKLPYIIDGKDIKQWRWIDNKDS